MTETERTTEDQTPSGKCFGVPRLVRLANGNWVRPDTITAIRVLPTERGSLGNLHRARVCVHHTGNFIEVLTANDDEHAEAMATELAETVNGKPNVLDQATPLANP